MKTEARLSPDAACPRWDTRLLSTSGIWRWLLGLTPAFHQKTAWNGARSVASRYEWRSEWLPKWTRTPTAAAATDCARYDRPASTSYGLRRRTTVVVATVERHLSAAADDTSSRQTRVRALTRSNRSQSLAPSRARRCRQQALPRLTSVGADAGRDPYAQIPRCRRSSSSLWGRRFSSHAIRVLRPPGCSDRGHAAAAASRCTLDTGETRRLRRRRRRKSAKNSPSQRRQRQSKSFSVPTSRLICSACDAADCAETEPLQDERREHGRV